MSVLADRQIRNLCIMADENDLVHWHVDKNGVVAPMLEPYCLPTSIAGVISRGESHCGYDLTLAEEFVALEDPRGPGRPDAPIIDPKRMNDEEYRKTVTRRWTTNMPVVIPPNSSVIGRSVEYIRIPGKLVGLCIGKSTYARCGIIANVTPAEPNWHGHLAIELSNLTRLPAVVYPNEGIVQMLFLRLDATPERDYSGKKYNGQTGVTLAKV